MIVVIQCAGSKDPDAGHLKTRDGKSVLFVADPSLAARVNPNSVMHYARPDDLSDTGRTWREQLLKYNQKPGPNLLGLRCAVDLYLNRAYARLAKEVGATKTYILSAGWGLIRGDFLTPNYDITFSASAETYKRRKKNEVYCDLGMLPDNTGEPVGFFGGKDYVPLFLSLTKAVPRRKVFYNSNIQPVAPGCDLFRFQTMTRTNWHYKAVSSFLDGHIGR